MAPQPVTHHSSTNALWSPSCCNSHSVTYTESRFVTRQKSEVNPVSFKLEMRPNLSHLCSPANFFTSAKHLSDHFHPSSPLHHLPRSLNPILASRSSPSAFPTNTVIINSLHHSFSPTVSSHGDASSALFLLLSYRINSEHHLSPHALPHPWPYLAYILQTFSSTHSTFHLIFHLIYCI